MRHILWKQAQRLNATVGGAYRDVTKATTMAAQSNHGPDTGTADVGEEFVRAGEYGVSNKRANATRGNI